MIVVPRNYLLENMHILKKKINEPFLKAEPNIPEKGLQIGQNQWLMPSYVLPQIREQMSGGPDLHVFTLKFLALKNWFSPMKNTLGEFVLEILG